MPKGFTLEVNPCVYVAKHTEDGTWQEEFQEKPHLAREEEALLPEEKCQELLEKRNSFPDLPLVNYTTQYGMGCFEGLKALPQKDGSLKIFRPDENAKRMETSMKGLMMPALPPDMFVSAVKKVIAGNRRLGFAPVYDPEWEKDDFVYGHSIYIRPFSYSEGAIGLGISKHPWVVIVTTQVGTYFSAEKPSAVTTDMIRATHNGTGWIKCNANYVIATLAKKKAEAQGYMEAIFLDSVEKKYIEEGSSCNIFFLLKNETLVTPELGDTILPGITRKSIIEIARDMKIKTEERRISIEEVLDDAKEVFVTGTAAGISFIGSVTHMGRTSVYNNGKLGDVSHELLVTLKGIQYGARPDKFNWMCDVKA
ncbi:MAG: branched chain amino acid aminotransferase [Spirochaetaceae bacterium]|nr:MAG: branched chain amino acid aminotransferase [Spirochaetaceae bacterium]